MEITDRVVLFLITASWNRTVFTILDLAVLLVMRVYSVSSSLLLV
jgi:hypothetical protein